MQEKTQNKSGFYHLSIRSAAIFLLLLLSSASFAQREKSQDPKKQRKEQIEMRQEREAKFDADMKARQEKHTGIQDKKTQRRMKRTRRRSERYARRGTSEPFWRRIFRKKHFRR